MLVVTVLVGVICLANSGVMRPSWTPRSRAPGGGDEEESAVTPEMMEGRAIGETFAKIGAFVFMPIAMFLTGLALWVVGKFFDAKETLAPRSWSRRTRTCRASSRASLTACRDC